MLQKGGETASERASEVTAKKMRAGASGRSFGADISHSEALVTSSSKLK
jgi:hypothetical protein